MIEMILLIYFAIWLFNGNDPVEEVSEVEQPSISEFGELDDKSWGKPIS